MSYAKELTNNTETKPGVATTEFLMTLALNGVAVLELVADPFNIPNQWVLLVAAVVTAVYAASRGLAKQGSTYIPVAEYDLDPGNVEPPVFESFEPNETGHKVNEPREPVEELAIALKRVLDEGEK